MLMPILGTARGGHEQRRKQSPTNTTRISGSLGLVCRTPRPARTIGAYPAKAETISSYTANQSAGISRFHFRWSAVLAGHQPGGPSPRQGSGGCRSLGTPGWADYSGVSRTLSGLNWEEARQIAHLLEEIGRGYVKAELQILQSTGQRLQYDGDLTGMPVSNTSQTFPNAAFGHMDDEICLGYQAAVVSLHSPTYGRLWVSGTHHPGDTVSCTQAENLVLAAEARTGVRPRRRTDLLCQRIASFEQQVTRDIFSSSWNLDLLNSLHVDLPKSQEQEVVKVYIYSRVAELEKFAVEGGVIMAYSAHVNKQADAYIRDNYYHWFAMIPSQNVTEGFHTEDEFRQYIRTLGIQDPDWQTPDEAHKKFLDTGGCLDWIPDCK